MTNRRLLVHIVLIAASLVTASTAGIGTALLKSRELAISDAQRNNENMAAILSQQVFQSVQNIDLFLSDIVEHPNSPPINSPDELNRLFGSDLSHDRLIERLKFLPQADVLSIIDAQGRYVVTTRDSLAPETNVTGRDAFERVKQAPDDSIIISHSQANRHTGDWTTYFTRRMNDPNGTYLAKVTVGVRSAFFLKFYTGLSNIPGSFLRLARSDGKIVASYPFHTDDIDTIPAGTEWFDRVKDGGGHLRFTGQHNVARLMAVKPVPRYPLVVNVGVSETLVLDAWRANALPAATLQAIVALFVTALICALYVLFWRATKFGRDLESQSRTLHLANIRFGSLLRHLHQGVAMFDIEDRLVVCNERYCNMYGLEPGEIPPGTPLRTILKYRARNGISIGGRAYEYIRNHANIGMLRETEPISRIITLGDGRHIQLNRQSMLDGGWVATHEDITARQSAVAQIEHLARHDSLTGLINRRAFLEDLQQGLKQMQEPNAMAVLLVDLDRFSTINDTFGHLVGDAVLIEVGRRLQGICAPGDLLARLGGDEIVIARQLHEGERELLTPFTQTLMSEVGRPYLIEGRELSLGLSIGITIVTDLSLDSTTILRQADLALYRAKADGRNCVRVFQGSMEREIQARRELAIDLDSALRRGEIEVYYQPIVDAQSFDVVSMEALARWEHPVLGPVSPAVFIPLAEEIGLISRLGEFVMRRALTDAQRWPANVSVSVNVSPIQITTSDFLDTVRAVVRDSGVAASRVILEITESVLLENDDRNLSLLNSLHEEGFAIALDDFGTGFSSLSYLNRFALDKIKIDQSFVQKLGIDAGATTIIGAVTQIAHAYLAGTTAEGVETPEQCKYLQVAGVTCLQGYLFGRPQPIANWRFEDGKAKAHVTSLKDEQAA